MFTDILKIRPKLENKDLNQMERTLQSRFTKVAKGFGRGLKNAVKLGGIAAIGLSLIDKILNPMKEIQEAIDRTLKTSDDLATNASQFNTTTGDLAKLVTLAKATGLDQDTLFNLINKFQVAVSEARLNPTNPMVTSVRNYTNEDNIAKGFFEFIQALNRMEKSQQVLVQQQIFGEKQILKVADFLQQGEDGFAKLAKLTGIDKVSSQQLTGEIERSAKLADLNDALTASREFKDLRQKSGLINEGMIRQRDATERLALQKENARLRSYEDLARITQTTDKIMMLVDQGVILMGNLIGKIIPFVDKATIAVDRLLKSPMLRGIRGMFGGKDE